MSQNVKTMYILGYLGGPKGGLQLSDWAYLAIQLSSHPYPCTFLAIRGALGGGDRRGVTTTKP